MSLRSTLRATPTLFRVGFAGAVAYRSEMLVWILATNMPLVMLALWTAVARDGPVGRFGQRDFIAYFLAALIVRQLTGAWVCWEMNMEIKQGTLGQRLLRPIHPFLCYAADNLAAIPLRAVIAFPAAVCALVWAGGDKLTHDPLLWCIVVVSVFGAWLITFSAMLMIGTLGLFFESSLAMFDVWVGLYFVLSGYLVPLELFPPWFLRVARVLPFPYVLGFPVETMLGLETHAQALRALGIQWLYVAAFIGAALLLWNRGLRRYAAYGG